MTLLKDSGSRTEFDTGAIRDCADGKGRFDLLPLEDAVRMISSYDALYPEVIDKHDKRVYYYMDILYLIERFTFSDDPEYLYDACATFIIANNFELYDSIFKIAKHFEDGAAKYSDDNWRKGIPTNRYIDSGIRHLTKFYRGDTDEPHDRAFLWNMLCCAWTSRNKGECNVYPLKWYTALCGGEVDGYDKE